MAATVHIDHVVRDYETWKPMFDAFDNFLAEAGARNCRVQRFTHYPNRVLVDVDFDSMAAAEAFRERLREIAGQPRSQEMLVTHEVSILELVDEHHPKLTASS
ncbi:MULTISPECIES: hypothetical protein [Nocardia]|uniref:hypothetical protein n=1 Tax=Nocardia TaxID=1817 RepID=UPI00135B423C|nr:MULTISPECIES: hypothetical protein [Nocardia]MBF6205815.1 hypothetical protein [Streptomyces gardneri]